ncbi:MAG: cell envelope integrity protein CreD [Pseudomonadota bacterium]
MTNDDLARPEGASQRAGAFDGLLPTRSIGLKLILVCGLALLMAIPALFVYGVVRERTEGAERALRDVSVRVGGEQVVLGPVLAVPYVLQADEESPRLQTYGLAIAYAETGTARADVTVEDRRRGIYPVPVFDAEIDFEAVFDPAALRGAVPAEATALWRDARLYMGVSDSRGVKEAYAVVANGVDVAMEPAAYLGPRQQGVYAPPQSDMSLAGGVVPGLETAAGPIEVAATMRLTGARRLALGPFAKDTSFSMVSDWEDPSFVGGVLPDTHNAGDKEVAGFSAAWRVPYLARGVPGAGAQLNLSDVTEAGRRDMAVRFVYTANPYKSVERALKYAAMFVGFVFLAYFLFETVSGARAHPAQYVLVGLAQTIFYLLLLAFAERVGFDLAFFIAAAMTVLLTSGYAVSVFRARKYGLRSLGVLSGIYGLVYVLMRAEDHALIAGAVASFAAIAVTMYMTRNVDWYGERRLSRSAEA